MTRGTCATCKWWDKYWDEWAPGVLRTARCRFNPPPEGRRYLEEWGPDTHEAEWCGQHQEKKP